jgi:polyferredoxin
VGIDIGQGPQLECIQCALCVDACNSVMAKVGLPRGLITYDTYSNLTAGAAGGAARIRLIRPRTVIYAGLIVVVGLIMLFALATRAELDVNVLRDRNPLFVALSDGSIRNGYTVKILNKKHDQRDFTVSVEGLDRAVLSGVGLGEGAALNVSVKPDRLRSLRVFVTVEKTRLSGASAPLRILVTDRRSGTIAAQDTTFRGPE